MKTKQVSAAETLFAGDSLVDIETGRNAGVETVVLTHGFGTLDELQSAGKNAIYRDFKHLLAGAKEKGW